MSTDEIASGLIDKVRRNIKLKVMFNVHQLSLKMSFDDLGTKIGLGLHFLSLIFLYIYLFSIYVYVSVYVYTMFVQVTAKC